MSNEENLPGEWRTMVLQRLSDLNSKLDNMTSDITELKVSDARQLGYLKLTKDHETRISALERSRSYIIGIAVALGWAIQVLWSWVTTARS